VDELKVNAPMTEKLILGFLRDEIGKVGIARAVIGLSGGIDSALAAALAARALGPENVVAVMMPYRASNPDSLADAKLVVEELGIGSMVVEITAQIDAYFAGFPDADNRRRGNKMARERMTILYDLSAVQQALVVGTSNKTEWLLGYTTLWGDMASAVAPIGDLYKTQVRQMAEHVGLPEKVRTKAPSADLWLDQTDEGELGFTYAEVDRLLYRLVDLRWSRQRCIEAGFGEAFVTRVAELMRRNQYKRRVPVVAKVSERTVDRDFRYPRDWGY
jgi:NAD+ synthase